MHYMGLLLGERRIAHKGKPQWRGFKMTTQPETVRVIVFQDNGMWVAQCLEYDIGTQADDIDTLNARLEVVLRAELNESMQRHGKPFAGIEAAPERFQLMWGHRTRSVDLSLSRPGERGDDFPPINYGLVA